MKVIGIVEEEEVIKKSGFRSDPLLAAFKTTNQLFGFLYAPWFAKRRSGKGP
jgi:hypothetical protein